MKRVVPGGGWIIAGVLGLAVLDFAFFLLLSFAFQPGDGEFLIFSRRGGAGKLLFEGTRSLRGRHKCGVIEQ